MKIGIIGMGNMGRAIYSSIIQKHEVLPYDPFQSKNELDISFIPDLNTVLEQSDYIILAVKPTVIYSILAEVKVPSQFISIAAGITIESIREKLPNGSKIVRIMPNLPLMVQQGCSCYTGDAELFGIVEEIFSTTGMIFQLPDEKLMDCVTGLSGSGPAFVFSFIQAMAEGGVKAGLSYADALKMSIQTVKGSAEYLEKLSLHPAEARNRVTSPGGTTIYGLSELEKNGFHFGVMESVYQAFLRARELG